MKKFFRILSLVLAVGLAYIIYEVYDLRSLLNNTKRVNFEVKTGNTLVSSIETLLMDSAIINESYIIENKDTVIVFETPYQFGLCWVISGQDNSKFEKADFIRYKKLDIENGRYRDYTHIYGINVKISYAKNRLSLTDIKNIGYIPLSSSVEVTDDLYRWESSDVAELRNIEGDLIYRVDYIGITNTYLFKRGNSVILLFVQPR